MKRLFIVLILICATAQIFAVTGRITTFAAFNKEINSDSGLELGIKAKIDLTDDIRISLGASEGYTANRSDMFNFNHAGTRVDIGVSWRGPLDTLIGYTHSKRGWFDGAEPKSVFNYKSVDKFEVRREFDF